MRSDNLKTDKNILIAFFLNMFFSLFELIGGILTGSIAITSDSIHDLGDAFSIGVSYLLEKKSKKRPDKNHTYGYIRYSVFGGIITTVILLLGSIFVIYEAIKRIIEPVTINYDGMILFAVLGLVINTIACYVTKDGDSLNQKSVNLHMLEDVLGWIVVLVGSIVIKFTNFVIIDSILSILVALFIFISAFKNLKFILDIFLEITPKNIDIDKIKDHILKIKGVIDIHHIHIRSIDGYNNYMTFHVIVKEYSYQIKQEIKNELEELGIQHSTIEFELVGEKCQNDECIIKNTNISHHHE